MKRYYLTLFFQALFALAYSISPLVTKPYFSMDALVLLYVFWTMHYDGKVGLGPAFCLGLFQDVLLGSLLGEHALALTLVAYLSLKLIKRMTFFSYWQQALSVGALVLVNQLVVALLEALQGHFGSFTLLLYPALSSALFWLFIGYLLFRTETFYSTSAVTLMNK